MVHEEEGRPPSTARIDELLLDERSSLLLADTFRHLARGGLCLVSRAPRTIVRRSAKTVAALAGRTNVLRNGTYERFLEGFVVPCAPHGRNRRGREIG